MTTRQIIQPIEKCLASVEGDAFAVMMLAVIFFSLGIVALLLWIMKIKAARRDPHVDALLEELAQASETTMTNSAASDKIDEPSKPWEKQADWWKTPPDQ
jgi:hypothetical protein